MLRAAVLGTGLIGTSVAIGLRAGGWDVAGWDPDPDILALAADMGAVDRLADDADDAVAGVDLVVLAGPVAAVVDALSDLETDALVTDVAGVKIPVVEAGRRLHRFIGGHPMAGRETSGPEGASGSMFRGATWVLTPTAPDHPDLPTLTGVVESLGAVPVLMSAEDHDRAVAAASHLPQLAANALVEVVGADPEALALAAGGFRDLTRVAMSDPGWWVDVLVANRRQVSASLRDLAGRLEEMAVTVDRLDQEALSTRMSASRAVRQGMAAPVATVSLVLEDRPGEMARVGHSLSESGVDLRDLQLRHAVHGGGGVLTLSVRSGEEAKLRAALAADGFRLLGPR